MAKKIEEPKEDEPRKDVKIGTNDPDSEGGD